MYIVVCGLNHRTAPVEVREKASLAGERLAGAYRELLAEPLIEGVVILSTCNRTEVYATTRQPEAGAHVLWRYMAGLLGLSDEDALQYLYAPNCFDAIEHLFRVSCGLDSMIIGETQILGQVKEALAEAMENGATDPILNTLFQRAVHAGKKVRHETGLDQHAVSISYAAVELAQSALGSLEGRTVVVVGAGEVGQLAAGYLHDAGAASVVVSNRSYEKACDAARRIGGTAVRLKDISSYAPTADILISCTSASHFVIRRRTMEKVMEERGGRPLLLIDIAVPRDIDPQVREIPGITLYDIDHLRYVVDKNLLMRKRAAREAETIIVNELTEFKEWLAAQSVVPVVRALRQKADDIVEREVARTLRRLGCTDEREERLIRNLASSVANQLVRGPIATIKEMAPTDRGHLYAELIAKMFGLKSAIEEIDDEDSTDWNQGQ